MAKKTIFLEDIADQMEACMDHWEQYLNTETGEFVELPDGIWADITEEDEALAEEIDSSGIYVRLPNQYDLREYDIMEEFADEHRNARVRSRLGQILRRRKPFRNFKDAINEMGVAEEYYAFRFQAFCEKARKWCVDYEIPYAWKNADKQKVQGSSF